MHQQKVAISHESGLVLAIMFAVIDEVHTDAFVSIRRFGSAPVAMVLEGLAVVDLFQLQVSGVSPFGLVKLFIQTHGIIIVSGDLHSMLVLGSRTEGKHVGLLDHAKEFLLILRDVLHRFPSISV